jgi:hypothetical protein
MIKSKSSTARGYSSWLEKGKMKFTDEKGWLFVGEPNFNRNWIVYISALTLQAHKILNKVIPLLKTSKVPFRLIRDEEHSYFLSAGVMQLSEVGKFISIYTQSAAQATEIIEKLRPILQDYLGPQVPDSIRIDKNIYAQFAFLENTANGTAGAVHLTIPPAKDIPFNIPSPYTLKKKKKIIGHHYLKMKTLQAGPKGEIMLAYCFKRFPFQSVVIKEGLHGTVEDAQGRDIRDRLLWQKEVLSAIGKQIPTAKLLDYFEQDNNSYLVIEYIDGKFLREKLLQLKQYIPWKDLPPKYQVRILGYYLQIINIIKKIHRLGYVYRDIQDHNFMITHDHKVVIIDFELAYNYFGNRPRPPFLLGSVGYMSPEQMARKQPTPAADIYALGSLLALLLTGEHPATLPASPGELTSQLITCTADEMLAEVTLNCMKEIPESRPALEDIEASILHYIKLHQPKTGIA